MKQNILLGLTILSCFYFGIATSFAEKTFDPKLFSTPSKFTLNGRTLITKSAFVVLTDEFFAGRTKALKILFSTEAVTAEAKTDILKDDGKMIRKKDHAFLVLFIDKSNQVWQVNFTFVVPGQTVAWTIASKPEELKKFSENYLYDGTHLKLKNKGSYQDTDSNKNSVNLMWDVDFDAPVFENVSTNKK